MKYIYVLHVTSQSWYGYTENNILFWTNWTSGAIPFNLPLIAKEDGWDNDRITSFMRNIDLTVYISDIPISLASHPELFI